MRCNNPCNNPTCFVRGRESEINAVLNIIQGLCVQNDIQLIAKMHNGVPVVAVRDTQTGKKYAMCRVEDE